MTYSSEVLADTPVVYFRLGDSSGTTMADTSGNGRNGTYVNSPTKGVTGALSGDADTAVTFTRTSSQYATFPTTGLPSGSGAYTLEVWAKPSTIDSNQGLISIGNFGSGGQSNALRLGGSSGAPQIVHYWWGNDLTLDVNPSVLATGQWAHIVATWDGTYRTIWVNGRMVGFDRPSAPGVVVTSPTVGRTQSGEMFNGTLDEAAVYSTALSATRIRAHYVAGGGTVYTAYSGEVEADGPIGYWRLNEVTGIPYDYARKWTGTSIGGTIARVSGLLTGDPDGAFDLNGTSNHIDIPTGASGTNPDSMTVEGLIRLDGSGKNQHIISRADDATGNMMFKLLVSSSDKAQFIVKRSGTTYTVTGTTTLSTGTTYHVAGVFDSTAGTIKVYVNGALEATTSSITGSWTATPGLGIGFGYNGAIYNRFDGVLDEIAYYPSALSGTRIAAHYTAAAGASSVAAPTLAVVVDALNPTVVVAAPTLSVAVDALNPTVTAPRVDAPTLAVLVDVLDPQVPLAAPTLAVSVDVLNPFVFGTDVEAPALGLTVNMLDPLVVTPISMDFLVGSSFDISSLLDVTPISMEFLIGSSFQAVIPRGDNPDPRTGRVQWRYVVTDRDGNRYGQLDKVTADLIEDGVNVTGETEFTIAADNPKRALIQPVVRECQVWRGRHLMHKGPILPGRPSDDGSTVTYTVPDGRWYLSDDRRVIGRVPKRNLLKNGDFRQALTYWRGGFETGTIPALPPLVEVVDSDISVSGKALQITGADKSQLTVEDVKTGAVFVPNESTYLAGGEAIIQAVGANIPNDSDVHIVGHTANNSINGDFGDGMALSLARANAAKATLLALKPSLNITTEGKGFYEPVATNSTEAGQALNRRVVISYEGTQSATGSAQYEYQKVTVSNPTSNGRPLTMTVSGWRELVNWIGTNVHEYGVYIQLVKASAPTVVVDSAYSTLNEDSTRDSPQRDSATVEVPANGLDYIVEVRFYAPNGTILWTRCELTPGDMLPFPKTDQALIVKGIVEHIQDTSKGKGDLGIGTRTPLTGVKRSRWYYEYERMHADQALGEFPALYRGMDIDLLPSSAGGDTLATYYPRQGGTSAMVLGPNVVVKFQPANSRDVASSVIAQADGSGADRDEAYARDTAALGGLLLERVVSAENETPVNELDEAAVAELGRAKVTTPSYWVECHPKHTNALLDAIGKGDRVRLILRDAYTNVDATGRVMKRRLDPNSDSLAFLVELEV